MLFDADMSGIENPANVANQYGDVGDLCPGAWFEHFANVETRDPERGFRRLSRQTRSVRGELREAS
jgi:uncharacterized protein involved in type VI secretion and phage assembly